VWETFLLSNNQISTCAGVSENIFISFKPLGVFFLPDSTSKTDNNALDNVAVYNLKLRKT
jgi:hypothetical protein